MKQFTLGRLTRVAAVAAAAIAVSACAIQPQTTEDAVMSRAQQRWDALVAKDFKKAYSYMAPSYRALVTPEAYVKKFGTGGRWTSVAVHSAKCEAERCQVKVRVEANVKIPLPGQRLGAEQHLSSYYDEPWVREDGKWWHYEAP